MISVAYRGPGASGSGGDEPAPPRGDHYLSPVARRDLGEDMADISDAHDQRYGDPDVGGTLVHRDHERLLVVPLAIGEVVEFARGPRWTRAWQRLSFLRPGGR